MSPDTIDTKLEGEVDGQPPCGLKRWLPALQWLPQYRASRLRVDALAGLAVVALLVPEGMAHAALAGVPPETAF